MSTCENLLTILKTNYCSVSGAATLLGVSRQHVVMLCQRGQLPGAQLALGRWWIPRTAIAERNQVMAERRRKKSQN
jgi:excisionase family DNA binding protein